LLKGPLNDICTELVDINKIMFATYHSKVKGEVNCKGKAIPLEAWTGPEGSRRLRLPDLKAIGT
jgi:hypothetical protein